MANKIQWTEKDAKIFENLVAMDMPLADIAKVLGISSSTALHKRIKRYYGELPSVVIERLQTKPIKRKRRPKIEWTDSEFKSFEQLCGIKCTQSEICCVMGNIDPDTLLRIVREHYGKEYSEVYKNYSEGGNVSLRRAQLKAALNGNTTMLVWLGKQWLGQRDQVEVSTDDDTLAKAKELLSGISSVIK